MEQLDRNSSELDNDKWELENYFLKLDKFGQCSSKTTRGF